MPDPRFTLRRYPRAKSLRIRVDGDGGVRVSAPYRLSLVFIQRFVEEKLPWIREAQRRIAERPMRYGTGSAEEYAANKAAALAVAQAKIAQWNAIYGFKVGRISIRNQRSRWGSCSTRGDICLNYRIAFLPTELQDYLVVHELCHIAQHNHSPKFWALVARTIPNYRELKRRLRF